ncbi:MAG TPA: lysophospholipid acyltransferase family protein [Beijerinckiaceae bacterium]|jgi:1-acyl-sn-glycerol-3-phosphate acyltransferase
MSRVGVAARLLVVGLFFAMIVGPQWLAIRYRWRLAGWLPVLFHRLVLRLFGVRVREIGRPPRGPGLVLANHVSWLDIPVMGSLQPLSFVAKSEIAGWPVIGLFAKLQRSVFIERARKTHTAEVNATVARRLASGDAVVLFPEGTTGDGNRLLPFRSSLVGAAGAALGEGLDRIALQPLAVAYTHRHGLPVTRRERPEIAWYGDMDLAPHLAAFVRGGPLDVVVAWGEPIPFDGASDRKRATAAAEEAVRALVREALAAR